MSHIHLFNKYLLRDESNSAFNINNQNYSQAQSKPVFGAMTISLALCLWLYNHLLAKV